MITRYCRFEAASFDIEEFRLLDHWGLVHDTKIPHTILGTPINVEWKLPYPII